MPSVLAEYAVFKMTGAGNSVRMNLLLENNSEERDQPAPRRHFSPNPGSNRSPDLGSFFEDFMPEVGGGDYHTGNDVDAAGFPTAFNNHRCNLPFALSVKHLVMHGESMRCVYAPER